MREPVRVLFRRLDPAVPIPTYAHPGDAGLDLRSAEGITLKPGDRALVPTGLAVAIPEGHAGFVQPRSGAAWRLGLGLANSPGLIDSGYRGELKVLVVNLDREEPIEIRRGDKIAQFVIVPVAFAELVEVEELPPSPRGDGGFGSTGR